MRNDEGEMLINGQSWEHWSFRALLDLIDEIALIRMGSQAIAENAPESQRRIAQEAYKEDRRREQLLYRAIGWLRYWLTAWSAAETELVEIICEGADDGAHRERVARALLELGVKLAGKAPPGSGELL